MAPASCDDQNTCTTDHVDCSQCVHEPIANCCGNGVVETGEECDDGNQRDFDGCSRDCTRERAYALHSITLLPGDQGCDLDGDTTVDNAFGGLQNQTARSFYSDIVSGQGLQGATVLSLFYMRQAGTSFVIATDVEMPPKPEDFFSGREPVVVLGDELDASGRPKTTLTGAPARFIWAFPWLFGTIPQPAYRIPIDFVNGQFTATESTDANGIAHLSGRFCGARTAATWHRFANGAPSGGATVLDLMVTGANFLGFMSMPTQPDIDVDGDQLERFADTDNDGNVDLCIDGNGTQITGLDCPLDPRIADAYSEAFDFDAIAVVLAGRAP
jgi:cysteine-rich repeat protein